MKILPRKCPECEAELAADSPANHVAGAGVRAHEEHHDAADIYGLGAVFYELLSGRPPFLGESALEIMHQLVGREPIPPRMIQSHIDLDLEAICLKCLEKNPVQRFGSAEALADDLERWLRHEPILTWPSNAWDRTRKWAKRNPRVAALAGALIFVTVIGFADSLWLWRRAERSATRETQRVTVWDSREWQAIRTFPGVNFPFAFSPGGELKSLDWYSHPTEKRSPALAKTRP